MRRFLITGLGNPGSEYSETRHNIGFKVLDSLVKESSISFSSARYGDMAELSIKGRKLFLLKPNTYMNLSGKAVRFHLNALKITPQELLVVTDDLALPYGKLRLKSKGSDGGHNGLKSLIAELSTSDFPRLRFGISNEFQKGRQVDYVLGEWDELELKELPQHIQKCSDCIKSFALEGINRSMNTYNSK
jgi:peptidyl-tRNA hydrolase, PTH1 family